MSPATSWTELTGSLPGWQDSIPSLPPAIGGVRITEDYFVDFLMEYGQVVEMFFAPEPPEAWSEMTVAATAHTELTVASTAWTEMT